MDECENVAIFVQASIPSLCAIMTVYGTALVPQTKIIFIISNGCRIIINGTVIVPRVTRIESNLSLSSYLSLYL